VHPDPMMLVRWRDRRLTGPEAEAIRVHLETCEECAKAMQTIERFVTDLDETWTRKRLNEAAARTHWPTREELVDFFLEDLASAESRREIEAHVQGCATCREILGDLERGTAALEQADPLGQPLATPTAAGPGWRDAIRAFLRPAAWPAWSLVASAAAVIFALGFVLRPILWPTREGPLVGPVAQLEKPALPRQPDGTLALGIGATTAKPEARALLEKALASYDAADFADRALPSLEQAVKTDPTFEQARFWLGVCYLLKGNAPSAIPHLEEAARLAPGNVTYQHYLVWGYLKAGEYRKALQAQTQLINKPVMK